MSGVPGLAHGACGSDPSYQVEAILVPALAADHGGVRLGRGAGYYDRALARVPAWVPVVALLHDGELVPWLPADPWDRPVTAAVTPSGGWTNLPLVSHHGS
jgi:5-formyltetrahydrofolate cyclo-ligase